MADLKTTLRRQKSIGEELEKRMRNYHKDSVARKNIKYIEKRINIVNLRTVEFEQNHENLKQHFDTELGYFRNNYYGVVKSIIAKFINLLDDKLAELKAQENSNNDDGNDEYESDDDYVEDEDENEKSEAENNENEDQEHENDDPNRNRNITKFPKIEQPQNVFKNGFNLVQMVTLFEIRCSELEKDMLKVYNLMEADNGKIRESTFFRIRNKLTEKLDQIKSMDEEIRVMGTPSCKEYRQFMKKNVMDILEEKIENALEILERNFEEGAQPDQDQKNKAYYNDVKLPRVKIPTFKGCYKEWQQWSNNVNSLHHYH